VSRVLIMKQLLALAAGAMFVVVGTAHIRSVGPSVVTVSLQRVAAQSNAGKRANQELETLRQERGRELLAKQKELEEIVRQLARADTLPAADRDRLSQDENRRRTELQQLTQQAQSDFQNAQVRLQTAVRAQLSPILADIAKRYGVDVVLNLDTVAWAAPGTDTTTEVLQRLNAPQQ
jgi:Skp family chaperone for outer membrane proteins